METGIESVDRTQINSQILFALNGILTAGEVQSATALNSQVAIDINSCCAGRSGCTSQTTGRARCQIDSQITVTVNDITAIRIRKII